MEQNAPGRPRRAAAEGAETQVKSVEFFGRNFKLIFFGQFSGHFSEQFSRAKFGWIFGCAFVLIFRDFFTLARGQLELLDSQFALSRPDINLDFASSLSKYSMDC